MPPYFYLASNYLHVFLFHQPIRKFSCWTIFPSWWSNTWLSALLSQSVSTSSVFCNFTILHGLFTRVAKQSSCPGTTEITMVVTVYLINSQLWDKSKSWCSCKYLLSLLNCKVARTLTPFLAAMSSSRSDVVTHSVRSSVRPWPRSFCSHKTLCKVIGSKMGVEVFQGSFNGVSRKFQGCFKEV